jgi:hypothetical protein
MLKIWIWVLSISVLSRVSRRRFQECNHHNIVRGPGQVTLRQLRIKNGALDAFRLPVDVSEGVCRHYPRGALANAKDRSLGKVFLVLALA